MRSHWSRGLELCADQGARSSADWHLWACFKHKKDSRGGGVQQWPQGRTAWQCGDAEGGLAVRVGGEESGASVVFSLKCSGLLCKR